MSEASFDVKGWDASLSVFQLVAPEDLYSEVFAAHQERAAECGAPDMAARATAHWAACKVILQYCGGDPVKLAECLRNGIAQGDWGRDNPFGNFVGIVAVGCPLCEADPCTCPEPGVDFTSYGYQDTEGVWPRSMNRLADEPEDAHGLHVLCAVHCSKCGGPIWENVEGHHFHSCPAPEQEPSIT